MSAVRLLNVRQAAQEIRSGAVIAYPTEAVFGLGCDPANEQAVRHLQSLKHRSPDAGFILIADDFQRFESFISAVPEALLQRARQTWPGPVSWLFPRAETVPDWLAGKHSSIALRVTAHAVCRELCLAFGGAIVSTSANLSGQAAPRSQQEVAGCFPEGLAGIVEGELGGRDQPSQIRDLVSGKWIRPG